MSIEDGLENTNSFVINPDTMTVLGFVLHDILKDSPLTQLNLKVKLQVINLLMYIPDDYITYLVESNILIPLLDILYYHLDLITIDPTVKLNDTKPANNKHTNNNNNSIALIKQIADDLCPLLILLTTMATKSSQGRALLKKLIFEGT